MNINRLIITPSALRTKTVLTDVDKKTAGNIIKQALDYPTDKDANYNDLLRNNMEIIKSKPDKIITPDTSANAYMPFQIMPDNFRNIAIA